MPEDLEQAIEQMLDEHLRQKTELVAQELAGQLKSAYAEAVSGAVKTARGEAAAEARQDFANTLAEAVRAIRLEDSVTGIASALVDGASKFCGRSLLFIHRGEQLLGFRAAGDVSSEQQEGFQKLSVAISQATAIKRAIEALDAVETEGGAEALSSEVVELIGLSDGGIRLFPVALRDKVLAVLACDAGPGGGDTEPKAVLSAAIETLVAVAEAWIEAVGTRRKQTAA